MSNDYKPTDTCRDVYEDPDYFKCSKCGGKMHGWTDYGGVIRYSMPLYCPNCGRKVEGDE